jgi:hypothetical protein
VTKEIAMDFSLCAHCANNLLPELLQCFAIAAILAPVLAVLKRLVLGSDELVLLRIG